MEGNSKFLKNDIKNPTCYCFDDIIKIEDFDFDNILLDEKSCKNVLVYDISCKTLIDTKPLCITFNKADGFTTFYNGSRYLVLFGSEKYNAIYNRIRYLISLKSSITYVISHNYARIKIDVLPLEKT